MQSLRLTRDYTTIGSPIDQSVLWLENTLKRKDLQATTNQPIVKRNNKLRLSCPKTTIYLCSNKSQSPSVTVRGKRLIMMLRWLIKEATRSSLEIVILIWEMMNKVRMQPRMRMSNHTQWLQQLASYPMQATLQSFKTYSESRPTTEPTLSLTLSLPESKFKTLASNLSLNRNQSRWISCRKVRQAWYASSRTCAKEWLKEPLLRRCSEWLAEN